MRPTDEIAANHRRARRLLIAAALPVLAVLALVGGLLAGAIGLVVAAVVAGAWAWWVWTVGPRIVRRTVGGRPADREGDARLHNLVEGLCSAAGVPKPELLVVDDPAPNALAAGLHPKHAVLVVTSGLLDRLNRVELEGILARELGRIRVHGTRPATVAVPLLTIAGGIAAVADPVRQLAVGGGATSADANGVALTRYPPGLVGALEKLRADGTMVVTGSAATAHLWTEPPGAGSSTLHPPLEDRIAALREL